MFPDKCMSIEWKSVAFKYTVVSDGKKNWLHRVVFLQFYTGTSTPRPTPLLSRN